MDELTVRYPTKCPVCGQESLVGLGLHTMLQALATDRPIKLHSNCAHHRVVWVASDIERRQIRDCATAINVSVADQPHRPRCYAHQ